MHAEAKKHIRTRGDGVTGYDELHDTGTRN